MKKTVVTINATKISQIGSRIKVMTQTWTILSFLSLCFFIVLGLAGIIQSKMLVSPVSSMKGLASSVSGHFFADMIGMEVPAFRRNEAESTFSQKHVSNFLFQLVTGVNPADPRSFLAMEVPGLGDDTILLKGGTSAGDSNSFPHDYTPSQQSLKDQGNQGNSTQDGTPSQAGSPTPTPTPSSSPDPNSGTASSSGANGSDKPATTNGKKVVFIYHSHNRESWIPELRARGKKVNGHLVNNMSDAYDPDVNITLVGEHMAKDLENLGIGAVDSHTDYVQSVADFNYNFSYKYSLKTVKEAFAANPDYTYFFDIHRDSQERDKTTTTIGGEKYAQIWFIIGHKNPNWEKNEALADKLHKKLEAEYPGLSKGIYGKGPKSGNAEYNQSFSANSILIEIGGPENTLEESNRTADALAKVISEVYWDAEKVNAHAGASSGK